MKIPVKIKNIWTHQFWPVSLMKDCSRGKPLERYLAYKYNQAKAYLLHIPLLNWVLIGMFFAYGLELSEYFQKVATTNFIYCAAFFAVCFIITLVPIIVLSISYLFLSRVNITLEPY